MELLKIVSQKSIGDKKNQDRASFVKEDDYIIGTVCDGTSSSFYAEQAAEIAIKDCNLLYEPSGMQQIASKLLQKREELKHKEIILKPEQEKSRTVFEDIITEKRKTAYQTTLTSFRVRKEGRLYKIEWISCGDSAIFVFDNDGNCLFSSIDAKSLTDISTITEVLPDNLNGQKHKVNTLEKIPSGFTVLISSDGYYEAFSKIEEIYDNINEIKMIFFDWKKGGSNDPSHLESSINEIMLKLHGKLEKKKGDDDISLVLYSSDYELEYEFDDSSDDGIKETSPKGAETAKDKPKGKSVFSVTRGRISETEAEFEPIVVDKSEAELKPVVKDKADSEIVSEPKVEEKLDSEPKFWLGDDQKNTNNKDSGESNLNKKKDSSVAFEVFSKNRLSDESSFKKSVKINPTLFDQFETKLPDLPDFNEKSFEYHFGLFDLISSTVKAVSNNCVSFEDIEKFSEKENRVHTSESRHPTIIGFKGALGLVNINHNKCKAIINPPNTSLDSLSNEDIFFEEIYADILLVKLKSFEHLECLDSSIDFCFFSIYREDRHQNLYDRKLNYVLYKNLKSHKKYGKDGPTVRKFTVVSSTATSNEEIQNKKIVRFLAGYLYDNNISDLICVVKKEKILTLAEKKLNEIVKSVLPRLK